MTHTARHHPTLQRSDEGARYIWWYLLVFGEMRREIINRHPTNQRIFQLMADDL